MDIALVRWPAEGGKRSRLASAGVPRLLLVEAGAEPPLCDDVLEDWVRLPVADADVRARIRALEARTHASGAQHPIVDESGLIRFLGNDAVLTPLQTRLMDCLVENFGSVVSRDELSDRAWPAGDTRRNTLDVHLLRLRRRLEPLGLAVTTVRSRGVVLRSSDGSSTEA